MSDDDFMEESDQEFEFEFEDDDQEDGGEDEQDDSQNLENKYYTAKSLKEEPSTVNEAVIEFQSVVDAEPEKGDWGFKSLKQMCKISFKSNNLPATLDYYKKLLQYIPVVTRNYSEKSINNILDFVSSSSSTGDDTSFLQEFYDLTLDCLKEANNDRLWTKTNLKLAKLWLDRKEYTRLKKIIKLLHSSCQNDDGSDDQKKGTLLLEIFAIEIQLYTDTKNNKKLKDLYNQCLNVKSAIPHPKIWGIIRECGGKMHMAANEYDKAQTDFFEAFKSYDEAGSLTRIQCLKYLVLANMLMESSINPFDSQETKSYKNDPEIVAMTDLVDSFQRKDIKAFEKILKSNKKAIMEDEFIRTYIDEVLKNIRQQVILVLIKPYTRVTIDFIADHLSITKDQVEDLLIELILDEKINAKLDQINSVVELYPAQSMDAVLYESLGKWSDGLEGLMRDCFVEKMGVV